MKRAEVIRQLHARYLELATRRLNVRSADDYRGEPIDATDSVAELMKVAADELSKR